MLYKGKVLKKQCIKIIISLLILLIKEVTVIFQGITYQGVKKKKNLSDIREFTPFSG